MRRLLGAHWSHVLHFCAYACYAGRGGREPVGFRLIALEPRAHGYWRGSLYELLEPVMSTDGLLTMNARSAGPLFGYPASIRAEPSHLGRRLCVGPWTRRSLRRDARRSSTTGADAVRCATRVRRDRAVQIQPSAGPNSSPPTRSRSARPLTIASWRERLGAS